MTRPVSSRVMLAMVSLLAVRGRALAGAAGS
nr:MAG TPA_asm: hypothetical protein [Caudoviricetes sp.]